MTLIPGCWRQVQHQFKTVWSTWLLSKRPSTSGVGVGHRKTQVQFLAPTRWPITVCSSSSRGSGAPFWSLQAPSMSVVGIQAKYPRMYNSKNIKHFKTKHKYSLIHCIHGSLVMIIRNSNSRMFNFSLKLGSKSIFVYQNNTELYSCRNPGF